MRTAILVSVIPGLLAAVAIVYAIRQAMLPKATERKKLRFQVRPVLQGQLGRVMAGFTAFEVGNVAATLLILRATDVLTPGRGIETATQIGIALYVIYNIAATITSFPAVNARPWELGAGDGILRQINYVRKHYHELEQALA